mgnify:CR=1 FL=1
MIVKEKGFKLAGLNLKNCIIISAFIIIAVIAIILFVGYYKANEIGEYEGTLVHNLEDISGGLGEIDV